jgi:uncharacterized protein YyaL (SSP411 family)
MEKHTNKLINESSPYLLQHAHNPVNWYPWGDEALEMAKKENKPILVSIGYSACHWCHVMERESFEEEATAAIMNKHFVNIKIDREERPDLDNIYMDAVQAMTGSGGWPLNVFLTPDTKPFYGGTYFPPQRAFNRPSWQETLYSVAQAFRERRTEIDAQAENLTEHLLKANSFGMQKSSDDIFNTETLKQIFENIMKNADRQWGGFGKAPKFPQTFSIRFLIRYYYHTRNEEALKQALLSLEKMIDGGIYDQAGGGFARYSTDAEWLAPHFEKMLYDNALLVSVISEAYQLTKNEKFKETVIDTMEFIRREMFHQSKGFFAALDADSEGIEGKFYVWTLSEINMLLGKDATLFCEYYDITEGGNWEHQNILWVRKPLSVFAKEKGIEEDQLKLLLIKGKKLLLEERNNRVRPLLDDKIILGWNALMNTACSKAYCATGIEAYRGMAIENMEFLLKHFQVKGSNRLHHTWKNGEARFPAFLDDYANLIDALINLQEITGNRQWLLKAKLLTEQVIEDFSDPETGFFYYTPVDQKDVIVRKKEVYDGAVPAGNSVMARNLWKLSILFDQKEWRQQSINMVASLGKALSLHPTSFGNWAILFQEIITGTNEITIVGESAEKSAKELLQLFIPQKVMMYSTAADSGFPLLAGKHTTDRVAYFLCSNYTCQSPVYSLNELMLLINKAQNT